MNDTKAAPIHERANGSSVTGPTPSWTRRTAEDLVDANWYCRRYPDVASSRIDPVEHYFRWGHAEGRDPNPVFSTDWYRSRYLAEEPADVNPLLHYVASGFAREFRPNPMTDAAFLRTEYGIASDELMRFLLAADSEADHLCAWFSREAYRRCNPGLDRLGELLPERHWLDHGHREDRLVHAHHALISTPADGGPIPSRPGGGTVVENWRYGKRQFWVLASPVTAKIVDQVREQGEIDPDVFAAGASCLASLRQFIATDIRDRGRFDHQALLDECRGTYDTVVILPALRLGGAEKYAANLVEALMSSAQARVLLVTTDPEALPAETRDLKILRPLLRCRRVAFGHHCRRVDTHRELILALMLLHVSPRRIFVLNSLTGLECVKAYGQQLGSISRLYCTFFSESPKAVGSPYSARFARAVLPHARVLSDNQAVLRTLRTRVGGLHEDRFVCIPPLLDMEVDARDPAPGVELNDIPKRPIRVLWAGRWDPFKATDVLLEIARQGTHVTFDVYGPVPIEVVLDESLPRNLRFRGVFDDPAALDLSGYTAFLFTSRFEGMPNVVLEFAALGVPVIASDVGGLRETFSGNEVEFVSMDGDVRAVAQRFLEALRTLHEEGAAVRSARIELGRSAVRSRHGRHAYTEAVARLLADEHWARP